MLELKVDNQIINYVKINDEDYISITDMLRSKDGDFLSLIGLEIEILLNF